MVSADGSALNRAGATAALLRWTCPRPSEFADLPAAAEVAAYRIVTEAPTTVARHSTSARAPAGWGGIALTTLTSDVDPMRRVVGLARRVRGSQCEQGLLGDLGQGGVNVEDVVGELVDGLAEHHRLEQGLEQDGGLGADDVGTEQGFGRPDRPSAAEAGGVFKSPPIGGVGVVVLDGDVVDAWLAGLEFDEPDGGQLRFEEHGVRDQVAVLVDEQPGRGHIEQVGVGASPSRLKQRVPLEDLGAPAVLEGEGHTLVARGHGGDGGIEPDVEASPDQLGEPGGEGLVLDGEQPGAALHDGDSAIRMMVSEVWNSTLSRPGTGGMTGRDPVDTTIRSALRCLSTTRRMCGPTNRAGSV